jgi:hypothetical protein
MFLKSFSSICDLSGIKVFLTKSNQYAGMPEDDGFENKL